MTELTAVDRQVLMNAIAAREGTAEELSATSGLSIEELRAFTKENLAEIETLADELEDAEEEASLTGLWIANKEERLQRYQDIADELYKSIMDDSSNDATVLREFRSYLTAAANELGQLMNRGAGEMAEGDTFSVDIQGVDPDKFR
jgi:hypothetical protein